MYDKEFFYKEVPESLERLHADTKPQWGSMTALEMLDHLRKGIQLSMENVEDEIVTPEDKLPAFKRFLMSDRPFAPGAKKPDTYDRIPDREGDVKELSSNLMESLRQMEEFFDDKPDHTAVHPNFGRLNPEEWWQLHYKHFTHHLKQFGLIQS